MWDFPVKSTTLRPTIPYKNTLAEKGYLHLHTAKHVLSPMVTGLPFFPPFFLSPIFVYFAEKVNPQWLQLNLFFLLFLATPLST
jgi:hypothetical protein